MGPGLVFRAAKLHAVIPRNGIGGAAGPKGLYGPAKHKNHAWFLCLAGRNPRKARSGREAGGCAPILKWLIVDMLPCAAACHLKGCPNWGMVVAMGLPVFPAFAPLSLDLQADMEASLSAAGDGVSEFTFGGLYLFRKRYHYRVSAIPGKTIVISGEHDGHRFFSCPLDAPSAQELRVLFAEHDYWKNISDSVLEKNRGFLESQGITVEEDRNNFDYLYHRSDLAVLTGKKYHKKRNLVNAFANAYPVCREEVLSSENIADAKKVLDRWHQDKGEDGDYIASLESLECFDRLKMQGMVFYVSERPAGYCLGERLAHGTMFAVHFEKAIDEYKGIYQYINMTFAASLPDSYLTINREQDLGDEGLRQAKETYRPCGFVKKYTGYLKKHPFTEGLA
jgi:hypothetical protein